MKKILGILLLAIVIVIIVVLLRLHSGSGSGNGDQNNSTETNSIVEETELSTEEIVYLEITISENTYVYQNRQMSLDDLVETLKNNNSGLTVKITDQNASHKAYTDLIKALDDNDIAYIEGESNLKL